MPVLTALVPWFLRLPDSGCRTLYIEDCDRVWQNSRTMYHGATISSFQWI
ncbi:Bgt-51204 [Blumeria graminis f. sp. tritici]|uniref:Bgt-51204 n=1 Tax=Blumeria graminis f. sp. tritici TaxID=62690 RepID=A0A9X9QG11_BLUGR|nr:Bgt-51204 [Blumeria graminis f. sp. tritici]